MLLNDIIDRISERPDSRNRNDNPNMDDEDEEGPKLKDIICECLKKCCGYLCILDCCHAWIKISQLMSWFVFDPFTELFITLCIAVNVIFMSLDHYSVEFDGM